jgi:hypothetical protein
VFTACPSPDLQRRRWLAAAPALGLLASRAARQARLERPRVTLAVGGLATLYYRSSWPGSSRVSTTRA